MARRTGRVASWDELRNDKIALTGIINQFYLQKSNLIGINGLRTEDILWRYIMINTEIEGLISNYIDKDSEYWTEVNKLKVVFIPDYVRMPQNSGLVLKKLSRWNQLLSREYARLNMLLTISRAAKI